MRNPWLSIPLSDYEGHMSSETVRQLDALSELFGHALAYCRPESIAIVGVAGGNGLDRIDHAITKRIVGLDINPSYLDAVRQRHSALPGLELHCADLARQTLNLPPVRLVHVALVLEHAGLGQCLENALSLVDSGGHFSVVLQLPTEVEQGVGTSPYSSIQALRRHFTLIDPAQFREALESRGFRLERQEKHSLASGKAFWMGIFASSPTSR
ncbi:MAG: class I SAM-dependent methyltransferase [Acidobacteria bacterium]|nr:class I SAM-dependent methyltransferase [Acidobacteriota bacterium]